KANALLASPELEVQLPDGLDRLAPSVTDDAAGPEGDDCRRRCRRSEARARQLERCEDLARAVRPRTDRPRDPDRGRPAGADDEISPGECPDAARGGDGDRNPP